MLQSDIANAILYGKCVVSEKAMELINKEKNGQDVECEEIKLMLLVRWIKIIQVYYFDNYNSITGNITPTIDCLSTSQATELTGKINLLAKSLCC